MNEFENIIEQEAKQQFDDDVFKKWFRTKDRSGFLSMRTWLEAGKVSIDIGETNQSGSINNTQVWTNAIELAVYLKAVRDNIATSLFPGDNKLQPETFTYYGGGQHDGRPISRILKVEYWSTTNADRTKTYNESAFAWKGGHFEARKTESGAFIPDMSKSISRNSIKISRLEMAEMSYRLDLALSGFVAKENDAFRSLNGNRK